jgi:hypothetical protein
LTKIEKISIKPIFSDATVIKGEEKRERERGREGGGRKERERERGTKREPSNTKYSQGTKTMS